MLFYFRSASIFKESRQKFVIGLIVLAQQFKMVMRPSQSWARTFFIFALALLHYWEELFAFVLLPFFGFRFHAFAFALLAP
jgi:hypothetical protein